MQKYSCPNCKSRLEIQKTFSKKILISCSSCGIKDLLDFAKNPDEVFLEFLHRFDKNKIPKKNQLLQGLKQEGIVRDEVEIKEMIGKSVCLKNIILAINHKN